MNALGQQVRKIKGPKPRGLTKFKPIASEDQQIEENDLSENQKRKLEKQRAKKEAEDKAKREEEERLKQEKIRKQKEREAKEIEERRLKTEEIFRGMALANEKAKAAPAKQSNFAEIM